MGGHVQYNNTQNFTMQYFQITWQESLDMQHSSSENEYALQWKQGCWICYSTMIRHFFVMEIYFKKCHTNHLSYSFSWRATSQTQEPSQDSAQVSPVRVPIYTEWRKENFSLRYSSRIDYEWTIASNTNGRIQQYSTTSRLIQYHIKTRVVQYLNTSIII